MNKESKKIKLVILELKFNHYKRIFFIKMKMV
jgi:hypothetical protein